MLRPIFFGKKKKKEKIPLKERAKRYFFMLLCWDLISKGFIMICASWRRLAERDREIVKGDTFEAASERYDVTPARLLEIMKSLKANKRCYWILTWVTFYFWLMGLGLMYFQGVTLSRANMTIASLGLMVMFAALSFKHEFRYWQCENRRLGNLDEFWAAGGGRRILKW